MNRPCEELISSIHDLRFTIHHPRPAARAIKMRRVLTLTAAVIFALAGAFEASAQRRPRPALSEGDARRAIAATPGFELRTGAVKVREVSARGETPVRVAAEVTLGFRFARVADEGAAQNTGLFRQTRWRAVELRAGDRRWEEFDLLSAILGAGRVEPARRALEELVAEYESLQAAAAPGARDAGRAGEAAGDSEQGKVGPLARGPLRLNSFSPLGPSAVAEVAVAAEFLLERDARRKWRVAAVSVGGSPPVDPSSLVPALDARKAERARADLEQVRDALERYRRERGLLVAADDFVALVDHLSPLYLASVVRVDPWRRPYLYAGAAGGYRLSSAGPDGLPDTPDDVGVSSKQ
jgi:hypothetical protein